MHLQELFLQSAMGREKINGLLGLQKEDARWTVSRFLSDIPAFEMDVEDLEKVALTKRFDVLAARQEIFMIAQVGAQKKWWAYTEALLGISFEQEADGTRELGPTWELAIPLFNYGQADRHRLNSQLNQSKQNLKALEIQTSCAVRIAQQKMISARTIAESYASQILPLRKKILQSGQRMYNVMTYGIYNLLDNKKQELESKMHYEMALRDYWIARAELERAIGCKVPVNFDEGT